LSVFDLDALETAERGGEGFEAAGDQVAADAEGGARGDGRQRVVDVVEAWQVQASADHALGRFDGEVRALVAEELDPGRRDGRRGAGEVAARAAIVAEVAVE